MLQCGELVFAFDFGSVAYVSLEMWRWVVRNNLEGTANRVLVLVEKGFADLWGVGGCGVSESLWGDDGLLVRDQSTDCI